MVTWILGKVGSPASMAAVDLNSALLTIHLVSSEGYQAFANQAGGIFDASGGLPKGVTLVTEVFLIIGLGLGAVEAASHFRRRAIDRAVAYTLPLTAIALPVILLARHTMPIHPYYLVTGFPMLFLFTATRVLGNRDYTVFVHFLGPDGKLVAQHDS